MNRYKIKVFKDLTVLEVKFVEKIFDKKIAHYDKKSGIIEFYEEGEKDGSTTKSN